MFVDLIEIQEQILAEEDALPVALARVEQLYPFPETAVAAELSRYPNLEELVWLQEEPANMGAWAFVRPCLKEMSNGRFPLRYIGRPRRTSPAEGSTAWHRRNQQRITEYAFHFSEQTEVEKS